MSATCVRCGRPMPDAAYACAGCAARAAGQLAEIADMAPAARDVAHGLSSRQGGSAASGKPGSRLPFDLAATSKLDAVQNALATLIRDIEYLRGLQIVSAPSEGRSVPDPLIRYAEALSGQLEWLRHAVDGTEPMAIRAFDEIEACARVVRGIARGPREQKYLGPCGAVKRCEGLLPDDWPEADCGNHVPHEAHHGEPCEGDVYGAAGATKGRCRACGANYDQGERERMLAEHARTSVLLAEASILADVFGLSVKTVRGWATERRSDTGRVLRQARLGTFWRDQAGRIVPWTDPQPGEDVKARGPRLHYVADVKELAEKAAQRRTKRDAAQAAEGEHVA